jgi:glycosyltransferase involved in cell wall biosynthesis
VQDISDILPLVSVIVPLYNGGKYIESTLKSILSQSYHHYEILVVDDGSTDDGPAKVSALMERFPGRMQLLHHPDQGNHWIAASRNLAIKNARGVYVAFVDQDDLWLPEKLERQVEVLQRFPEAAFVYAKSIFVDQQGEQKRIRGIHLTGGKGIAGNPRYVFGKLIKENFIPTLTVLVHKRCLERIGFLDEGPRYEYEDWLLLSKIAFFYKAIFIPEVLSKYRVHNNNYSAHLFDTGQLNLSEEHYTITLFLFLMNQTNVSLKEVRKYLHRRIWFFFLRTRSWGASKEKLEMHASNFLIAFPKENSAIQTAVRIAMLLHPKAASTLRRLRRKVVGI